MEPGRRRNSSPPPSPLPPDAVLSRGRSTTSRRTYERLPSTERIGRVDSSPHSSPERSLKNDVRRSSVSGLGLNNVEQEFAGVVDDAFNPREKPTGRIRQHRDSPESLPRGDSIPMSPFSPNYDSAPTLVENTPALPASRHCIEGSPNPMKCSSRKHVIQKRTSWLAISILILALYSTVFSGIYLIVAFVKPRYGNSIGSGGALAPSTASLLSAFFAKTIELSFVTVFVAFLGQVLTRRALAERSPGISIADMSMRSWIMQPGTLITHWENVRYSAMTILGMTALTTAWMAMLYTTAAETLVSPRLKLGPRTDLLFYGHVTTKFSNPKYLQKNCLTPISTARDELHSGPTCMQLAHVGQSYHNYQQYLAKWASLPRMSRLGETAYTKLENRPPPIGTWYDNTTFTGEWIDIEDATALSEKNGRLVNIVTAALPHTGVFAASRHPKNNLRQPADLNGQGEFQMLASVASPAIKVTCVGMTEDELAPIIYNKWPNTKKLDPSSWITSPPSDIPTSPKDLNKTVVDKIFGFGKEGKQRVPIFPKLPIPYNTLLNGSGSWPLDSLYMLGASDPASSDTPYVLCGLKGGMTSKCATGYHATSVGGNLTAHCPSNTSFTYDKTSSEHDTFMVDPDWKNVAMEWASAVSLGTGISDANSSNARLLMQLNGGFKNETKKYLYDPLVPSLAEALAAMAASTALMGAQGSSFALTWKYGENPVIANGEPVNEQFPVQVRVSEYASGGTEQWQGIFYVVLIHVFLINLVCVGYLYIDIRGSQVTDFTEPQNIFALAINSPSSSRLIGACGAGPEGRQLRARWRIEMDEQDEHYYITGKSGGDSEYIGGGGIDVEAPQNSVSPAVTEYRKLQQSRHSLGMLSRTGPKDTT